MGGCSYFTERERERERERELKIIIKKEYLNEGLK